MLLFRKSIENVNSHEGGIEENLKIHDYAARHMREYEEVKP
jgi:hypothetical protein